ncbi:MAG: glycosyl transferase family 1 [Nitrospirae bacterium]|nr:glycosyl transferase family 1 [Nitrospirota bacterium]
MISRYTGISPKGDLTLLGLLGEKLKNKSFLHVNSTKEGGGVAEILHRMVPIMADLGIDVRWETIEGDEFFFDITKRIHNALQGNRETITKKMWQHHFEINRRNAENMPLDADMVLIHDPQPAPLITFKKSGRWVWRCHIDVSNPVKEISNRLFRYCGEFDAAVFSVARFAKAMGIDEFIIPPSIDPLSEKNIELPDQKVRDILHQFNIPSDRPIILQVSRFDRFKDPIGVIEAFRMVRKYNDCILVLVGSPATDDPEGELVLQEVREHAASDKDIHVLLLPPFSDLQINAFQKAATVVLQKSLKEGFGLTVSEAMWKGKPVIGGAVGGIPLQIVHGITGFLVHSVEGTAFRIRQFLNNPEMARRMGEQGREHVRKHFLITRQTRDYLSLWYTMENKLTGRRGFFI